MEPDTANDYSPRDTQAVEAILIELGQVLASYRRSFVIVGGAVPFLQLRSAEETHVGTFDVDLNLDPDALSDGEYANLVALLERRGYERNQDGLMTFQLRRTFDPRDGGPPVSIVVDLLMPRSARPKKNRPPLVENLRVQGASGGEVALKYCDLVEIAGRMPDGRPNTVTLQVATLPALLVMKGYALVGRDKKKDAYDIYYVIRNSPGGAEQLGIECRKLLGEEGVQEAYQHILSKFKSPEDFGPETVRMFLEESNLAGGRTAQQIRLDAFLQVQAWAEGLGVT